MAFEVITPPTAFLEKLHYSRRSLARGAITSLLRGGESTARTITRSGIAFKELREYDTGDELKHIHWNSSARAGKLLVKTYEEELQEKFFVIVDDRLSMLTGFTRTLYEIALEHLAFLFSTATDHHQQIGGMLLSGTWNQRVTLLKKKQLFPLLSNLFQPKRFELTHASTADASLTHALESILMSKEKRLNIFFLSSYLDDYSSLFSLAGTRHKLYLGYLDLSITLPAQGLYEASSPDGSYQQTFDFSQAATADYFQQRAHDRYQRVQKELHALRPTWIQVQPSPEESFQSILT
jgi:uncharacterized protein (DUF58 family)